MPREREPTSSDVGWREWRRHQSPGGTGTQNAATETGTREALGAGQAACKEGGLPTWGPRPHPWHCPAPAQERRRVRRDDRATSATGNASLNRCMSAMPESPSGEIREGGTKQGRPGCDSNKENTTTCPGPGSAGWGWSVVPSTKRFRVHSPAGVCARGNKSMLLCHTNVSPSLKSIKHISLGEDVLKKGNSVIHLKSVMTGKGCAGSHVPGTQVPGEEAEGPPQPRLPGQRLAAPAGGRDASAGLGGTPAPTAAPSIRKRAWCPTPASVSKCPSEPRGPRTPPSF